MNGGSHILILFVSLLNTSGCAAITVCAAPLDKAMQQAFRACILFHNTNVTVR